MRTRTDRGIARVIAGPTLAATMPTPLDRFFDHYYHRRPVNATLTGVHDVDSELPDWSRVGLASLDREMADLESALAANNAGATNIEVIDAALATDFLAIQRA